MPGRTNLGYGGVVAASAAAKPLVGEAPPSCKRRIIWLNNEDGTNHVRVSAQASPLASGAGGARLDASTGVVLDDWFGPLFFIAVAGTPNVSFSVLEVYER